MSKLEEYIDVDQRTEEYTYSDLILDIKELELKEPFSSEDEERLITLETLRASMIEDFAKESKNNPFFLDSLVELDSIEHDNIALVESIKSETDIVKKTELILEFAQSNIAAKADDPIKSGTIDPKVQKILDMLNKGEEGYPLLLSLSNIDISSVDGLDGADMIKDKVIETIETLKQTMSLDDIQVALNDVTDTKQDGVIAKRLIDSFFELFFEKSAKNNLDKKQNVTALERIKKIFKNNPDIKNQTQNKLEELDN